MDKNLQDLMGEAGFGELDNHQFEQKEAYQEYFIYIKKAFKALNEHFVSKFEESRTKSIEKSVVAYFITRLQRSIELLNLKYQYDLSHSVRVDVTESSFPNHTELRQMKADHNLKDSFIEALPNALILKDKLIAKLRIQDEEPYEILDALSKRKYFNNLIPSAIYLMFNTGKLIEGSVRKNGRRNFIHSFSTYDMATNRPIIYVLDFEYSSSEEKFNKKNPDFVKYSNLLENVCLGSKKPFDMVAFMDQELEWFHPKLLKRYDIGPLFGMYSQDENAFTKFHKRHKLNNKHFIIYYEEEVVVSVGEEMYKSKWLSSKVPLQKWHIKKDDVECAKRKISDLNKYLIAPHEVVQLLLDDPKMTKIITPLRNNIVAI